MKNIRRKINSIIRKVYGWLVDHEPVKCLRCGKWLWNKDTQQEIMTTGTNSHLCPKCHDDLFNPWSNYL